jgi:hypothetical protein
LAWSASWIDRARGEGAACARKEGRSATISGTIELPPPPRVSGLLPLLPKIPRSGKAALIPSDRRPSLPESTCDTANMTTKNANSRVMKSAYDTSQRSWLTCSCFLLRRPTVLQA